MANEERRHFSRVPLRTVVRLAFNTIGEFLQSYARNMSEGGMQLAVAQELQEGDLVALEFRLKSNYPLIEGTAQVRWCRPQGEHYLVGVEFREIDERSRRTIRDAIHLQRGNASSTSVPAENEESIGEIDASDLLAPPDDGGSEAIEPFEMPEITVDAASEEMVAPVGESTDDAEIESAASSAPPTSGIESFDFGDLAADESRGAAAAGSTASSDAPVIPPIKGKATQARLDFSASEVSTDAQGLFDDTAVEEVEIDAGAGFAPELAEEMAAARTPSGTPPPAGKSRRALLLGGVGVGVVAALALAGTLLMSTSREPGGGESNEAAGGPEPEVATTTTFDQVAPAVVPAVPAASPTFPAEESAPSELRQDLGADAKAGSIAVTTSAADTGRRSEPRSESSRAPVVTKDQAPRAAGPARNVVGFEKGDGKRILLVIVGDGSWSGRYKYFGLRDPYRAVIDLAGVGLKAKRPESAHPNVSGIRLGPGPDRLRVVLDLNADRRFHVEQDGDRLLVIAD